MCIGNREQFTVWLASLPQTDIQSDEAVQQCIDRLAMHQGWPSWWTSRGDVWPVTGISQQAATAAVVGSITAGDGAAWSILGWRSLNLLTLLKQQGLYTGRLAAHCTRDCRFQGPSCQSTTRLLHHQLLRASKTRVLPARCYFAQDCQNIITEFPKET